MRKQISFWQKIDSVVLQHSVVDHTITFIDKVFLRPVPILWATGLALVGFAYAYLTAYDNGFVPSGSELWIFFVAGWVMGFLSETLVRLIRSQR